MPTVVLKKMLASSHNIQVGYRKIIKGIKAT